MARLESIENHWDILYRDYPEVYEDFWNTPYHPTMDEQIPRIIDFRGKCVADGGGGGPGEMIVWGGISTNSTCINTGGRYRFYDDLNFLPTARR